MLTESTRNRKLAEKLEPEPKCDTGSWPISIVGAWELVGDEPMDWRPRDFHHDCEMTMLLMEKLRSGRFSIHFEGTGIFTDSFRGIDGGRLRFTKGETIGEAVAIAAAKAWGPEE